MDENNNLFWNSDEAGEETVDNNSLADTSYRSAEAKGDRYLFVNSYRVKEEHIKEFYFSSLRSVSFIIWCIVAAAVVIGVVLYTIFSGFDPLWTFAGVLWALYPIFRLYVCLRSISLYKMRLKESYGGELPQQVYALPLRLPFPYRNYILLLLCNHHHQLLYEVLSLPFLHIHTRSSDLFHHS